MGLCYIGKIVNVEPIENADFIQRVDVVAGQGGKWSGVVRKADFSLGDQCQVYLPDALMPQTPEFAFMEQHKWRVRMRRYRGMPSECLIMPQTIAGEVGDDITEAAGVVKYEKPIPVYLAGLVKGDFPYFIPKTDEPNFQSVPVVVEAMRGKKCFATVKIDGCSGTFFFKDGEIGVCSRNLELKEDENSVWWRVVHKYKLNTFPWGNKNIALQFEIYGEGIQGNPLGIKGVDLRLFNVWDIAKQEYYGYEDMLQVALILSIPPVEMIWNGTFNMTDEEMRKMAEGIYPNGKQREGIVIRTEKEERVMIHGVPTRLSVKSTNLLYKD